MRLLIDTHIFLWAMSGDKQLTKNAEAIMLSAEAVFVSAASIWEIEIKSGIGKLDADVNELVARMEEAGFRELPVTVAHAAAVRDLPDIHRDPFDRLLVAQAITEPLRLLTNDDTVGRYSELVITI
ncbi:type II toxin-antitoxin system VapC family toxin [Paraburkholderia silvatlantica]|nr:type II toxin-antitoxin system VapC family toxin [Paraburkholderia silvatlantica]MBB2930656.1 PIN domain nuclease of toxin-antitoxin system [Paraburkholderia silvatlantica]PVY31813.1 PIN domain nuclease of toxin-antitoxin system [Paraburkholderia silvatlantica]PXW37384.1 PIN domain nuclease of toxin-antitoxin system [Paraburkholderia silvatlantica]PYE18284.1 PIN domain nuclease of toxin-antitoxin system [Paraburkholderia silvatlantica]TDQ72137.1 PIN domain nuclease of toxin-antitoxin system